MAVLIVQCLAEETREGQDKPADLEGSEFLLRHLLFGYGGYGYPGYGGYGYPGYGGYGYPAHGGYGYPGYGGYGYHGYGGYGFRR